MHKGDMYLPIMEHNKPKTVFIKEGEVFILPSRIPHSPQRKVNTIGLVIERERLPEESDCLRWYCEDSEKKVTEKRLYEEYFHCYDLGVQLRPIMQNFLVSEPHKTGVPLPGSITNNPPVIVDDRVTIDEPFPLSKTIEKYSSEIKNSKKVLYNRSEFKLTAVNVKYEENLESNLETFYWQFKGTATIIIGQQNIELHEGDVYLVKKNEKHSVKRSDDSISLVVTMDPLAAKSR